MSNILPRSNGQCDAGYISITWVLHRFGALDSQPAKHRDQFPQRDGSRRQQERPSFVILFGEDVVVVVEVAEILRQLEGVLGQVRRLRRGDALIQHQRAASGSQPESPDVFVLLAAEKSRACVGALRNSRSTASAVVFPFAEDVADAHRRVLHVGASLAFKAQRIFEIEGDHRVARELAA